MEQVVLFFLSSTIFPLKTGRKLNLQKAFNLRRIPTELQFISRK